MTDRTDFNGRLLVVDDTPVSAEVLSEVLRKANYDVRTARDGLSAIEIVNNDPPELILLDVIMPGIDGFETCRRLKANPEHTDIPVIFITGSDDTDSRVHGLEAGAVDYITKPFEYTEAISRIEVHLRLYRLNRTLEHQVEERTAQLRETVEELQTMQMKLIQGEKMSALGQLVAGVAHEINNPVNFIQGNIVHAENYIQDLLELVSLYQKYTPEPNEELEAAIEDADLDFLQEDLPKLLKSMRVGTDRIRNIVKSLRNFSRTDDSKTEKTDIHDGLDSTLMILSNRTKAKPDRAEVQVVKIYGALPLVECYPGPINQVFMNILANATDALEEKYNNMSAMAREEFQPTIWIETISPDEDHIEITIADNGLGIPAKVRHQIFDSFFTTKPKGKGTGIGMSISREIVVDQHHGKLDCQSSSMGAKFIITLPVCQPEEDIADEADKADGE
ncbi:MAG: response regulator [Coleofasciculaceae cyanobacterium RL_1_1]|nr:response regulator [Coleofasciculaceae cyanobacterium RL_1_1]